MQSSGDQILYNKQTGRHHVVLGHSKLAQGPVKDNIVLGSGSLMPPMSIMRPPTCDGVLCQNGGHCVVRGSRTKCNCPFGFGGTYCQKGLFIFLKNKVFVHNASKIYGGIYED